MSLRSLIALFLFQIVSSNPYLPLPISGASNEQSRLFNYIYNLFLLHLRKSTQKIFETQKISARFAILQDHLDVIIKNLRSFTKTNHKYDVMISIQLLLKLRIMPGSIRTGWYKWHRMISGLAHSDENFDTHFMDFTLTFKFLIFLCCGRRSTLPSYHIHWSHQKTYQQKIGQRILGNFF